MLCVLSCPCRAGTDGRAARSLEPSHPHRRPEGDWARLPRALPAPQGLLPESGPDQGRLPEAAAGSCSDDGPGSGPGGSPPRRIPPAGGGGDNGAGPQPPSEQPF
eukprot:1188932-Prorocentrum_minimum.AAC.2